MPFVGYNLCSVVPERLENIKTGKGSMYSVGESMQQMAIAVITSIVSSGKFLKERSSRTHNLYNYLGKLVVEGIPSELLHTTKVKTASCQLLLPYQRGLMGGE